MNISTFLFEGLPKFLLKYPQFVTEIISMLALISSALIAGRSFESYLTKKQIEIRYEIWKESKEELFSFAKSLDDIESSINIQKYWPKEALANAIDEKMYKVIFKFTDSYSNLNKIFLLRSDLLKNAFEHFKSPFTDDYEKVHEIAFNLLFNEQQNDEREFIESLKKLKLSFSKLCMLIEEETNSKIFNKYLYTNP